MTRVEWFLLALNRAFNIDPIPLGLALLALAGVVWARRRLHRTLLPALHERIAPPIAGESLTRSLLATAGREPIPVVTIEGMLADRYDPATRTLRLSPQSCQGGSITALSLSTHAAGQALLATGGSGELVTRFRDLSAQLVRLVPPAALLLIAAGFGFNILPLLHLGLYAFAGTGLLALMGVPLERRIADQARAALGPGGLMDATTEARLAPVLDALAWRELAAVGSFGRAPRWQRRATERPALVTDS